MKTFKEVKKGQYIYRVRLTDYVINKIRVCDIQDAQFMWATVSI